MSRGSTKAPGILQPPCAPLAMSAYGLSPTLIGLHGTKGSFAGPVCRFFPVYTMLPSRNWRTAGLVFLTWLGFSCQVHNELARRSACPSASLLQ
jgi:hypothetical protein